MQIQKFLPNSFPSFQKISAFRKKVPLSVQIFSCVAFGLMTTYAIRFLYSRIKRANHRNATIQKIQNLQKIESTEEDKKTCEEISKDRQSSTLRNDLSSGIQAFCKDIWFFSGFEIRCSLYGTLKDGYFQIKMARNYRNPVEIFYEAKTKNYYATEECFFLLGPDIKNLFRLFFDGITQFALQRLPKGVERDSKYFSADILAPSLKGDLEDGFFQLKRPIHSDSNIDIQYKRGRYYKVGDTTAYTYKELLKERHWLTLQKIELPESAKKEILQSKVLRYYEIVPNKDNGSFLLQDMEGKGDYKISYDQKSQKISEVVRTSLSNGACKDLRTLENLYKDRTPRLLF